MRRHDHLVDKSAYAAQVGFVFGFQGAANRTHDPISFILFDWTKWSAMLPSATDQREEAMRLAFIDTEKPPRRSRLSSYLRWTTASEKYIARTTDRTLQDCGWHSQELYDFKAAYGPDRLQIWMKCYGTATSCAGGCFNADYRLLYDVTPSHSAAFNFPTFPTGGFGTLALVVPPLRLGEQNTPPGEFDGVPTDRL